MLILQELDKNPRSSLNEIGKRTRIAKETVQYRVQKLEDADIIRGYWVLPRFGRSVSIYKVFLKSKGLIERESFESFVTHCAQVSWFTQTSGSWSYILTIISKEDWRVSQFLSELFQKYSSRFVDIQIMKSIAAISLNEKYLYDKAPILPQYVNFLEEVVELDTGEIALLGALARNARAKYSDLAKDLNITPEAVSYRMKSLLKKNAISALKLRINHAALNRSYYHVMISLSDLSSISQIEQYFIHDAYTVFLMRYVGKYQLHVEIVCEHIQPIMNAFLDSFAKVVSDYDICKIEHEFKITVHQ